MVKQSRLKENDILATLYEDVKVSADQDELRIWRADDILFCQERSRCPKIVFGVNTKGGTKQLLNASFCASFHNSNEKPQPYITEAVTKENESTK